MRLIRLTLVLALSSLAFAPAPLPRPRRGADPSAGIEGAWRSGEEVVKITPNRMAFLTGDRQEYVLRLNRAARPPAFDLESIDHTASHGVRCRGIYRVRGDVLTLCYSGGGNPKPASFGNAVASVTVTVDVYTRVK